MKRRTTGTPGQALALAAALCAVLALPGTASAEPGDLPPYRTADDAKPRKGTASSADGPRLAKGGVYTDTLAPGEKKYYSVELDAKSSAWLSAVAQPRTGSKVAFGDGISVVLEDTDGTGCSNEEVTFGADGTARPLAANAGRVIKPDDGCQDAGVYNFSVERESENTSDPSVWPVELRFMQEPPVKGTVPTTPPETGNLPTAAPDPPTGEPEKIKGGTGFNDAVGMDEGVWKDRLRPGETRFYRVPVDWGQRLMLSAEFGTAQTSDENAYASGGVRVDVYNPARGYVGGEGAMYQADDPAAVPFAAAPVDYVNRYSYDGAASQTGVAGWYYVAVHAKAELGDFVKGSVPVTLRTSVTGKAEEGPSYEGDAAEAGFGVTDEDKEQATDGVTADEAKESGDDGLNLLAYGGIGAGTVLLLVLGVWTLTARRRAAPADAVPYPAGAPGPYGTQQYPQQYPGQQPPQGWG
ncbi:hypothetical protein LHJ74_04430 [Streptomyces sp. N2-109]|uniref:Uncharacterized protein n=1 Tax=Streptomyces gossypii TaxID=2883101 RepID=A0ABT2JMY6_9ACTN|nr:hypothetical protein [Streptomyces gossypii]MCT2589186.1 hypothetical protein [Streptomyces gossypii]